MKPDQPELLQGTLDLMVLKTLDTLGAMHGYGIAQRPADLAGRPVPQPGNALPGAAAARAVRLDPLRMGRFREQPQGQVLLADQGRAQAASGRDRRLAAHVGDCQSAVGGRRVRTRARGPRGVGARPGGGWEPLRAGRIAGRHKFLPAARAARCWIESVKNCSGLCLGWRSEFPCARVSQRKTGGFPGFPLR
jgi:hypothetical protein